MHSVNSFLLSIHEQIFNGLCFLTMDLCMHGILNQKFKTIKISFLFLINMPHASGSWLIIIIIISNIVVCFVVNFSNHFISCQIQFNRAIFARGIIELAEIEKGRNCFVVVWEFIA